MSALIAVVALVAAPQVLAGSAQHTVHIRGTAYEFNNTKTLLGGATIRVAEFSKLKAVVQRDGSYDLAVPDHAKVTPYIVDPGYHTIYLQTFTTDGEDLTNVNFQTPTEAVYRALAALLKVPLDAHGNLVACAIVSTFSTRNVRDLSYQQFRSYGAHGVAGATATSSPTLPKPVYFNKDVIPDPKQRKSSKDGGVVWTSVPSGVYTITAHDPSTRFASFVAACRPGRVVNANPPWGLYQFARPNPAQISAGWSVNRGQTRVVSLLVRDLPKGAVVGVQCTGPGCRFRSRTFRPTAAKFDMRRAIGDAKLQLSTGDHLDVTVSAHAFNGVVLRLVAKRGQAPHSAILCIPLGYVTPQRQCPTG